MTARLAQAAEAAEAPVEQGVFDVQGTELALFVAGAVVTLVVLSIAVWLFIHASRDERAQRERERKERGDAS